MSWLSGKAAGLTRRAAYLSAQARIPTLSDDSKRRIAIITGELEVGGVGRVLLNIIKDIPRQEFDITIFTTDPRVNAWAPEFAKHVDRIVDIPPVIGRSLPAGYIRRYLESYLGRNRMDVIFITNSAAAYNALPAVRAGGASSQAAIYDLMHTHGRPQDDDAFLKLSMPFDQHIDTRIVISQYLKDYYCGKYPVAPDKVRVIYNGIDEKTAAYTPDVDNGRKLLGLTKSEQAISYLGRLQSDKSPHRLVELATELSDELDKYNTFIAVVGEGELAEPLHEQARRLGIYGKQVRFFPFSPQPMDICAASSFTIITSDLEGIPMATLESMQVRTPVLAPAVGGLPEIVDDGVEGYVTSFEGLDDAGKTQALAAITRKALATTPEQRQHMGRLAHKKVHDRFESMGQIYLDLFRQQRPAKGV